MNTLFKAKDFLVHLSTFCKHLFFIFRWAVNGSLTSETYSFQRHERALCFRDWLMKRQNVLCTSKTRCNSSYSRKAEVSTKKNSTFLRIFMNIHWNATGFFKGDMLCSFPAPSFELCLPVVLCKHDSQFIMCFTLDLGCPLQTEGVNSRWLRLLCSQTEMS